MLGRALAVVGLVAVAVVAVVVVAVSGSEHRVRVAFASAQNVVRGAEVRIAGRKVGSVVEKRYVDGGALLELRIDEAAWPLRGGTTAAVRFGTTIATGGRFVELRPGPRGAPAIPQDGVLERDATTAAFEFDELFDLVDGEARRDLRGFIVNSARSVDGRRGDIARSLRATPGGLTALADVLHELDADPRALRTLLDQGARTAAAVRGRDAQLRALLDGLAATFDELAGRARPLTASLERFPATLRDARATLARTDRSLVGLRGLVGDLAPGARGLRALAPAARDAVNALRVVAPLATATLRRGTSAAPDIRGLLRTAAPFMARLRPVLERARPSVGCARPYGPEIAAFLSTWAGFGKNYDGQDHYARVIYQLPAVANGTPLNSLQTTRLLGLKYAFPLPPGRPVGQTWFQPQCGAGPEALDPARDPEARR